MGRDAGWIALHSGLAGGADVILIPEIPFTIETVCEAINRRQAAGRSFCLVVVAEGARLPEKDALGKPFPKTIPGQVGKRDWFCDSRIFEARSTRDGAGARAARRFAEPV